MSAPQASLTAAVVLDCPDPVALAGFYAALLGWPDPPVVSHEGGWVDLANPAGGMTLEFQRAAEYQAPTWPDPAVPQQFHLDIKVSDLDTAEQRALGLGAKILDVSPDHPTWRVYADPVGHPFCLCAC
ncbi:MAG TPA: VOC family protein [Pseudonocardiaceae bacterium]|nr:VOC family protein [Pseudonocardiaceae bacterium]